MLYLQNTTGASNTALGHNAAANSTTASNNTALGVNALNVNTTGATNTAVGAGSLLRNTTASNNTTVGYNSLDHNTTGADNVAIGSEALTANTTASNNTAVGRVALATNTTGASNVAVGLSALRFNTTGADNVAIGASAAINQTTASNNTIVGASAGATVTDASSCILIGREANISSSGNSELVIGNSVVGKGDNTGFISPPGGGNLFQGTNATTWAQTSDERIKKNIVDNNEGLSKLKDIQVRNFEYRTEDEVTDLPSDLAVKKEGMQLGVIAQEIEKVLPEVVITESNGVKTVNTDNLTWYLVNAVKELSMQVDELKAKLNEGE